MIISNFLQNRHDILKIFYNTDIKASNFLQNRHENLEISAKPP